jgi:hypothetical protein
MYTTSTVALRRGTAVSRVHVVLLASRLQPSGSYSAAVLAVALQLCRGTVVSRVHVVLLASRLQHSGSYSAAVLASSSGTGTICTRPS